MAFCVPGCFDPEVPERPMDAHTDAASSDGQTAGPDGKVDGAPVLCTATEPPQVTINAGSLVSASGGKIQETVVNRDGVVVFGIDPQTTLATIDTEIKWLVYERSPIDAEKGIAVASADGLYGLPTGADDEPFEISPLPATKTRPFDLAFEQASGEIVVVYPNTTRQPAFRTWSDDVWSEEAAVPADGCGDIGEVLWVELTAEPGTDNIAAGIAFFPSDSDHVELCALVWDGNGWMPPSLSGPLNENLDTDEVDWRGFDLEWTGDGSLLAAWTILMDQRRVVEYAQWLPGGGAVRSLSSKNTISFVDLAAAGDNCDVAGAFVDYGDPNERLYASLWTAGSFGKFPEVDEQIREFDSEQEDSDDDVEGTFDFPAAAFWYGDTPILVYADDDTNLSAASLSLDWERDDDVAIPGLGQVESIRVGYVPGGTRAFAAMVDDNGDLFAASFDGEWAPIHFLSDYELASGLPTDSVAFDIQPIY